MSVSHTDDSGAPRVDFVWGNMPMQPNDERLDNYVYTAGVENVGWSGTQVYYSDTLRTNDYYVELNNLEARVPADSHIIAALGYSNYPAYIPNYSGDEDTGFETVVPDIMRKTLSQALTILDNANLNLFSVSHNPEIQYIESNGTTVRVYCYDTNASGGGYPEAYLVGLKVGDKVWVDNNYQSFGSNPVEITKVNEDGGNSWIEFTTETSLNLDDYASGTIWPGPDLDNVITVIRSWNQPGSIRDEWTNVHVRYLGGW